MLDTALWRVLSICKRVTVHSSFSVLNKKEKKERKKDSISAKFKQVLA